ncbi:hypothetical protein PF005_g10609 [Phytophthora fragariae]|uniref:Secreted protein n=1 Tax=Phytophthora fragariae TaxID=53985 RepID=A0A6A3F8X9_9STRA|nr:hypothetical protein PF003_g38456 [Phytophthora fragariae]KAE8942275.1 hypothetical protein PF009_g7953 [Phytophthora fragariae]KAE9122362.1 hypothetical protein PF007_g7469 [Phytophthora fragariae]KAE9145116.1 hypothetical protein PF006_g9988 [Phytophthora fragariae]KAE9212378.1 hypothetical protein PF005_g10609 [Phytophthora fragariae]
MKSSFIINYFVLCVVYTCRSSSPRTRMCKTHITTGGSTMFSLPGHCVLAPTGLSSGPNTIVPVAGTTGTHRWTSDVSSPI